MLRGQGTLRGRGTLKKMDYVYTVEDPFREQIIYRKCKECSAERALASQKGGDLLCGPGPTQEGL